MAARIRFNGRWAGGCKATGQVFAADGEPFNEAADNPVPEAFSVGGSRGMCPVNREHSGPQVRPFPAECSTFFHFRLGVFIFFRLIFSCSSGAHRPGMSAMSASYLPCAHLSLLLTLCVDLIVATGPPPR